MRVTCCSQSSFATLIFRCLTIYKIKNEKMECFNLIHLIIWVWLRVRINGLPKIRIQSRSRMAATGEGCQAALTLSLPLCVRVVSVAFKCATYTRLIPTQNSCHTLMYFFYVIASKSLLENRLLGHLPPSFSLVNDFILPLSKYFNFQLVCIKHDVSFKKIGEHMLRKIIWKEEN